MTWGNLVESFRRPVELVYGYRDTQKQGGATDIVLHPDSLTKLVAKEVVRGKISLPKKVNKKDLVVRIKDREEDEMLIAAINDGVLVTLTPDELVQLMAGNPIQWSNITVSVKA